MAKKSKLSTLGSGIAQGATLGFTDEATNTLGALLAKTLQPELFEGMALSQANIQQHKTDNPKTQFLGEILGAGAIPKEQDKRPMSAMLGGM